MEWAVAVFGNCLDSTRRSLSRGGEGPAESHTIVFKDTLPRQENPICVRRCAQPFLGSPHSDALRSERPDTDEAVPPARVRIISAPSPRTLLEVSLGRACEPSATELLAYAKLENEELRRENDTLRGVLLQSERVCALFSGCPRPTRGPSARSYSRSYSFARPLHHPAGGCPPRVTPPLPGLADVKFRQFVARRSCPRNRAMQHRWCS